MADARRRLAVGVGLLALAAAPVGLALTDAHLAPGPPALVVSTAAGALAVSALTLQPLLAHWVRSSGAAGAARRLRWHQGTGVAALALVLVHVGGLFAVEVDDTLFALSPDGPTRARMALIATLALVAVVFLGVARGRLRVSPWTWRIVHAYLAVLVIVLGLGHAVLTDGALDGLGTPVLLAFGAVGVGGAAYAHVAPRARARAGPPPPEPAGLDD